MQNVKQVIILLFLSVLPMKAIAQEYVPPLTDYGCRYEDYGFGNDGQPAPPGSFYRYCVCDQNPGSVYPGTWQMPSGGFTWPQAFCRQLGPVH